MKSKPKRGRPDEPKKRGRYLYRSLHAITDLVARLIERFGWGGAVIILSYSFIVQYATPEQKHEIIDRYFLGKGIEASYSLFVVGGLGLLLVWATHFRHVKRERIMQQEIDRLAEWKSAHQQARIGTTLHHTENRREE